MDPAIKLLTQNYFIMKKCTFLLLFIFPTLLFAQKPEIVSAINNLVDAKKVNVKFDFSGLTFYNEKMTERQYVSKRMKDIAEDKGEAEAEKWHRDWIETRDNVIPNKFISELNDKIKDEIDFGQKLDTKYTLTVKVEWVYPGYFAIDMSKPAKATTTLTFTDNSGKVLLQLHNEKLRGKTNFGFTAANNNERIADVFGTTGAYVGKFLRKKLKKLK